MAYEDYWTQRASMGWLWSNQGLGLNTPQNLVHKLGPILVRPFLTINNKKKPILKICRLILLLRSGS